MQIFLMYNNGQSPSLMPVEVQSQTAKLDDKLSKCLDAPTNSPFELPLAVGVHGKKPDTFKGVEITGIFQAVPLDPRNLQRSTYGDGTLEQMGLENMKMDLGRLVDAGAFAQIETN